MSVCGTDNEHPDLAECGHTLEPPRARCDKASTATFSHTSTARVRSWTGVIGRESGCGGACHAKGGGQGHRAEEAAALGTALGASERPLLAVTAVRMKQTKAPGREARRRGRASAQTKLTEFRKVSGRVEDAGAETAGGPARVEDTDARLGSAAPEGGAPSPWAWARPWPSPSPPWAAWDWDYSWALLSPFRRRPPLS